MRHHGEPTSIPEANLEFNDAPRFVWICARDAINLLWKGNAKLHSLEEMKLSIKRHGFQELPKFDVNLENVSGTPGAIKAGNGRVEAVFEMESSGECELPRGMGKEKSTGFWVLPILTGTDAESEAAAKAYAIDSNNLTLAGNFDIWEQARLWDREGYAELLRNLQGSEFLPVTMNQEDIANFLRTMNNSIEGTEYDETIAQGVELEATFKIKLPVAEADNFEQALDQLLEEFPQATKQKVI